MTPTITPQAPVTTQDAPKAPEGTSDKGTTQTPVQEITPLDGVRDFVTKYVALSDIQADVITLWAAHTWAFQACETTPYIAIQSIEPASGKTLLLEVCEQIVASPWLTSRTTGPALVRKVGSESPTLLLDETDCLFTGGNASQQMLRGVLNSGYRLGGKVSYAKGGSYEDVNVFCPKMFAGLTSLPATVASRSIPIVMRKRTSFDRVERFRQRDVRDASRVPRMILMRFGSMHLEKLTRARPLIPSSLDDRAADCWEPLLAIAEIAGGSWPERARKAAVELMKDRRASNTEGVAFKLLGACRSIFTALGTDRLQTSRLIEALCQAEEWANMDGRPIDSRMLADLLRGFSVTPGKIRFGRQTLQGYERRAFDRACASLHIEDEEA